MRAPLAAASLASLLAAAPGAARAGPKGVWYETRTEITGIPGAPPQPQVDRECIPPGFDGPPRSKEGDDCRMTGLKRSAGKVTFKIVCEGGFGGEGEIVHGGDTFTTRTAIRTPMGEIRSLTRGKKIGGACDPDAEEEREEALEQYAQQGKHGLEEICAGAIEQLEPTPFMGAAAVCREPAQKAALCKAASAPEAIRALLERERERQRGQLAKLCGLDVERHRARLCAEALKLAQDGDGSFLAESCRAEAAPLARKECAGRSYTATPARYRDFCSAWAAALAEGEPEREDGADAPPPPPRKRKASRER